VFAAGHFRSGRLFGSADSSNRRKTRPQVVRSGWHATRLSAPVKADIKDPKRRNFGLAGMACRWASRRGLMRTVIRHKPLSPSSDNVREPALQLLEDKRAHHQDSQRYDDGQQEDADAWLGLMEQ